MCSLQWSVSECLEEWSVAQTQRLDVELAPLQEVGTRITEQAARLQSIESRLDRQLRVADLLVDMAAKQDQQEEQEGERQQQEQHMFDSPQLENVDEVIVGKQKDKPERLRFLWSVADSALRREVASEVGL